MPLSPSSSSATPLECPVDVRSGQPLVWNFDTADRLLSELADNEPLISLDEIIEQWRAELEAPFISSEAAALAVTAVKTTTAPATTTRAHERGERFAPTP